MIDRLPMTDGRNADLNARLPFSSHRLAFGILHFALTRRLRDLSSLPRYSASFDRSVAGIFASSGTGVKSSPGLMNRSDSNLYCLSYSVR
jgi:hypothetical protein